MSDVSGIPYMGPMGQGNFFAPAFSYNPQINPTAGYAAPIAYNQNVVNNLYTGGGFGAQTAAYAYAGAAYDRMVARSTDNPYRYGGVPASLAYPGASLSGGYTTGPANMPSFDTGPNFGYTSGGAGAIDLSRANNPFSGGLGSGGGYNGPSIDWSGVGQAAAGMGGGRQDPYPGMSMPGGLGSPMGGSSGASPFNWSDLWSGGGGGGYSSGIPPDTTGGRAPSVDWNNIQSPPTNYDAFQGGGGGTGGYSSGIAPDTTGGRDFEWPAADPAAGMAMPGGLGSPMTMPQETTKAQDQAPFDLSGPTAGWNDAPAPMPNSEQLLGYDPQKGPVETDWSTFQSPATNYDTFQAPAQEGGGGGTDKLVEEARQRLAGIIGSPETAKAVESPATDYNKFQQPGTAATDALRPPDKADTSLEGRIDTLRNTLKKEIEAQGLYMTSDYRGPGHPYYRPGSQHSNALAFDTRARTPEQADAARAQIKELFEARGMKEGRDFTFIDEVRHPILGITKGPHLHTTLTPEGMQRYQESAYDVNAGQVIPRPPADIPPQGPLPPERPQELPEGTSRPPADVGTPFVNNGVQFGPPAPPDYRPPAAAPVKHSGLELARANIDTPIERIAMERGGQKAVDQVSSMAIGKTPRELMQSYGGLFMSRAEPLFSSLGITRSDFEKAITMPQTKQDLKMRFGEGEGYGPYPAYTGPEDAPGSQKFNYDANVWEKAPNTWADFRQSTNIDDQRGLLAEPPGMLDPVKNWASDFWANYGPQTDPGPLGRDAGINELSPNVSAAPRFMGSSVNDDSWTPQERTPQWNTDVYVPSQGGTVQHRDEGGVESRWSDFAKSGNIVDRRFDTPLTRTQEDMLRTRPGVPNGSYVESAFDKLPIAGGELGEWAGTKDITALEAASAARQRAELGAIAREPAGGGFPQPTRAFDSSFQEGDVSNGGYNFLDAAADETSMRDFRSPANDYSAFQAGWGNPFIRTGGGQPDWDSGGEINPATGQPGTSLYPGRNAFDLGPNYSYQQQQADLQFQRAPLARQLENDPAKQAQLTATVYSELGPNPTDRDVAALLESLFNRTVAVGGSDISAKGMLYPGSGSKQYYEGFIPGGSAKEKEAYRETENNPEFQSRVWDIARQVLYGGSNVADLPTDNASAGVPAIDTRNPAGWGETFNYATQPFPGGPEFYLRKDNPVPGAVPSGSSRGQSTRDFVGGPNVDAIRNWYASSTGKPWAPAASPPWPGGR